MACAHDVHNGWLRVMIMIARAHGIHIRWLSAVIARAHGVHIGLLSVVIARAHGVHKD